jgi:hypothetical protein
MKKDTSIYGMALLCLLIFSGCGKKNNPVDIEKPVVHTPAPITITLPKDSVTLSGTATDATGSVVGYLWSQVSGPAEASLFDEGSNTAMAKKLVAGKYVFQFSATDNHGLSARDTVSVTVVPSPIFTLSLSPSNNPGEFCLGIWNGSDWSNGTSIEEPLSAWTKDLEPTTLRSLLKFDLSSIPTNATIVSANLYLYSDTIPSNGDLVHANMGSDNSVLIQQVSATWAPSTLNWFNQPAALTTNEVIVPSTTLPFLNINVDVKSLIGPMVSSNANYGFLLSLQHEVEYTSRIFCSSYYSDVSRHPRLVVTYEKN